MSAAGGARAVRAAIESRTFDPAYYFYGEDDFLKEETARRLIDAAVDAATRDFNLELRRASDLDSELLGSLLGTPPMMAERRAVVVRDVGALKKDARAMLDRFLESPPSDVLVLLTSPAGAKADKLLCERATAVDFEPLSGAKIPKWIAHYVEHELKSRITQDAMGLLQDAVGDDLAQIKTELDKLASYAESDTIDERAVGAIVGVRREETLGSFLDAVARRDVSAALTRLPGLLQQPKLSGVQIVMALATQTLALAWGRAQRDRGTSAGRLPSEFYSLLKENPSSYTGRSWGEAVNCWSGSVDRWSAGELDAALGALLQADAMLKESRLSSEEQLLANLVLSLCGAPTRRTA
jgi:DNA polymerase III subunit delta